MLRLVDRCSPVRTLCRRRRCVTLCVCLSSGWWKLSFLLAPKGTKPTIVHPFESSVMTLVSLLLSLPTFLSRAYRHRTGQLAVCVQCLFVLMRLVGLTCGVPGSRAWCRLGCAARSDSVSVGSIGLCGRCLNMCGLLMAENMRPPRLTLLVAVRSLTVLTIVLRPRVGLFTFTNMIPCIGCWCCVSIIRVITLVSLIRCCRFLWLAT